MNQPYVSYLTSHKGNPDDLKKSILSVSQDCRSIDYEHLICLDGCNIDHSLMLRTLPLNVISNIKLFNNKTSKGKAYCVNNLISVANGSYLFFLDSDDVVLEGHTSRSLSIHQTGKNSNLIISSNYLSWNSRTHLFSETHFPHDDSTIRRYFPIHPCLLYSSISINKANFLEKSILLDDKLEAGIDYEFYSRCLTHMECRILKEPSVLYRTNSNGITRTKRKQQLAVHKHIITKLLSLDRTRNCDYFASLFMHHFVSSDFNLAKEFNIIPNTHEIDNLIVNLKNPKPLYLHPFWQGNSYNAEYWLARLNNLILNIHAG